MGFRGMGMGSLLLIFLIILILFGTKRLREMGGDLGAAIKGFRKGIQEDGSEKSVQKMEE